MKRACLRLAALVAAAAFLAPVAAARQTEAGPVAAAEPGEVAVRLRGLDGKTYDTREMRGQVVVISFGATWCAPCRLELIAIEELKEEYKGRPVRFLWASVEEKSRTSNAVLKHYAKSSRLTIPVLRDEGMRAFAQFSASVRLPVVVFIGRDGRLGAPPHHGMSQDVTEYKRLVRSRVDALLGAEPGAAAGGGDRSQHQINR